MSKFLDYSIWFIVTYPLIGLIVIVLSTWSTKQVVSYGIIRFTEIINIVFGIWLLIILINSLAEAKENTGKYFYDDTSEWLWYVPICLIVALIFNKKLRRANFSILLFSFILIIAFFLLSSSLKLAAP